MVEEDNEYAVDQNCGDGKASGVGEHRRGDPVQLGGKDLEEHVYPVGGLDMRLGHQQGRVHQK